MDNPMRLFFGGIVLSSVLMLASPAKGTFSIVVVDTITGEVGSAGASCISGSHIITSLHEGIGAIHTQALWLAANQANGDSLMALGLTPDSIMSWLANNDVGGDPGVRQYGATTLAGSGASASFTGSSTTSWAGHRTGPGYAIQGNILLGPQIVDSMEFVYLNTPGRIEDRLMAALEAAKVVGADTRCAGVGKSALSAFIRVVRIGDGGTPYLAKTVVNTAPGFDPIDVLRQQYDAWKILQLPNLDSSSYAISDTALLAGQNDTIVVSVTVRNNQGQEPTDSVTLTINHTGPGTVLTQVNLGGGDLSIQIVSGPSHGEDTLTITVESGGVGVTFASLPVLRYFECADINGDGNGTDISDLTYLVAFMFGGGPPPMTLKSANVNGMEDVDISDLTYLVSFMFGGGPAPVCK